MRSRKRRWNVQPPFIARVPIDLARVIASEVELLFLLHCESLVR